MKMGSESDKLSFWEHLDVLRGMLLKAAFVTVAFGIVAFFFKDELFSVILAPKEDGFVTYRLLGGLSKWAVGDGMEGFSVSLINTGLASQFVIHMQVAMAAGLLCASPYVLYQLFRFVSPALYADERRYVVGVVGWGYLLFMLGVLVSYFLVFPLTFHFLGTYQVSAEVENMITLHSYISTLLMMCLSMGIVFEIPVLSWLFAKLGFLTSGFMRTYRKHAVVVILIVAAVITPTSDVVTLLFVSQPMWALYEVSIWIVRRGETATKGTIGEETPGERNEE